MNIIETYDLSKSYGRQMALDLVNFAVSPGAILGVVGPKGAGKTTLLRILATLAVPTAGDALIAGNSVTGSPSRIRRIIGYMPYHFGIYPDMTVDEYLRFFAESYSVPRSEQTQLIADLLALTDLSHHRTQLLDQLSRGMRNRLNLARALAHDPQVLLMDEPFTHADPRSHAEMRELIKELRNMGKTVLLTAPVVADIAQLCTDIMILEQGHVILSGAYSTVYPRLHHHRVIVLKFFGNAALALTILRRYHGVRNVSTMAPDRTARNSPPTQGPSPSTFTTVLKEIHITYDGNYQDASDMLNTLMRSGVQVVSFNEQDDTAQTLLIQPETGATDG
jgi:ABC-2 type transport system ATP-binding protein